MIGVSGTSINWACGDGSLGDPQAAEVTVLGKKQGAAIMCNSCVRCWVFSA